MTAKQTLLDSLRQNRLEKILDGLSQLADTYKDKQLQGDAAFQSSRLKAVQQKIARNTISRQDEELEMAKIRVALLELINDLPDSWPAKQIEASPASSSKPWQKYILYGILSIVLVLGLAEMLGYGPSTFFQQEQTIEPPVEPQTPAPKVSTTGDNSPAVITRDGDVNISYGAEKPEKDSTQE